MCKYRYCRSSDGQTFCKILYLIVIVGLIAKQGGSTQIEKSTVIDTNSTTSTTPLQHIHNDYEEGEDDEDDDDDWDTDEGEPEIDDEGRIYKNPRNSPSPQCPRDSEQATIMGQKCLRKCYADEDCKSKKKKCLCDGACGMSCIKPDRECPTPDDMLLGTVTTPNGRLFGARAIYTCPHGYHVVGLQSRPCRADGKWAGSPPACKQNIYCLEPPLIDHARHNALAEQTTFDLDATLQYYCHSGYVTNGFPRAKCLAVDGQAAWYGPDIVCEPRSCGMPVEIPHGWHAGECYTYGCRTMYHCADGYELVGKNDRFCQADGTWSPKELPTCVLVTSVRCTPPENPRHGKSIYTSCSYNSVVSYECKYGYVLVGESTRRCGADKRWSGTQPTCKEINCGHPGRLWNGWLENIEGGTGLGASIIFRCHEGTLLEGNSSTVCQVDGKWRYPPPKCLAPCVVPHVTHGRVHLIRTDNSTVTTMPSVTSGATDVVQHGEALTVECDDQYEFVPEAAPVTCNNGTWTQIPRCEPARCKHLPRPPKYGMVIVPKMEHGMRARFMCKDGFQLRGETLIQCSYGHWIGETPRCEEVFCPYPGLVENGRILLVGNMGLYDYRPYVRKVVNNKQIMYECLKGYYMVGGPPGATCISGKWSPPELPKCALSQHPRMRFNRRRRRSLNEHRRFKRGLKGGSGSRTLGTAHRGSSSSISLRRGNKKMKNAYEEEADEKRLEQRAKLPCDPLQSDPFVNVEVIRYGKDRNATYSSGTVVKMACGIGYELNMAENRTAKCVKGKWRPTKPRCLIIPCYIPGTPFGVYTISSKGWTENSSYIVGDYVNETDFIPNGQVVNFGCEPGYAVQGPRNMRCWHGDWAVSTYPECTPAPCQLPQITHGQYSSGYRGGLTIANGSSMEFHCEPGFIKSIDAQQAVTCVLGALHPRKPSCRSPDEPPEPPPTRFIDVIGGHSCGPPNRVYGSLVFKNGEPMVANERTFPHGTEVRFSCIENVMGEKTAWKIICEDGGWIGRALSCGGDERMAAHNAYGNGTCIYRNQEPNVISFYNDREITEDVVDLPPDSVLVSRCTDIGKYAMTGSPRRICVNGDWDGSKPVCFGLNQENDYSVEKPPTILFRHELGPIGQSNDGKLVVYPGTILHMECLWMRKYGAPKWNVSHDYRKYPEGWATDEGRDAQLEFRLSIVHASKDDSGRFTCMTPARYTHFVDIEVKAVHCPAIAQINSLLISTQNTKMNTELSFSCSDGKSLVGVPTVTCQPSGNWSAPLPTCEKAQCSHPGAPENGYMQGSAPFRVGTVVQFNCHPNFMMEGQPIIACQENAQWSAKVPKCLPACSYPGTTISGQMSSVKFYYKIGENITFSCDEGLLLKGAAVLKCLRSGKWSNTIPTCLKPSNNSIV